MSSIYFNGPEAPPLENPLAQFKSYSYYHVLAVCDSTTTANSLANYPADIVEAWLHPGNGDANNPEPLGPWSPKPLDKTDVNSGKYCILINGATDAGMVITNVSYSALAAAGATNNDRFTSLATEGTIEISEPKGITFLDLITRCCASLGRDPAHVVFILKTFFVGYDDNDNIKTISNVAPMTFIITNVTGSFSDMGGEYKIEFVAMNNGAARLPQYDKMMRAVAITGTTLTEVVANITKSVSDAYDRMFSCIEKQVQIQEKDMQYNAGEISNRLKKVKYEIQLADIYKGVEYEFKSVAQNTSTGTCNAPGSVSTGTDMSLESALRHMMDHCPRVAADAKEGITTSYKMKNGKTLPVNTKINYRIHTVPVLDSSKAVDPYKVIYRIEPYPVPREMIGMEPEVQKALLDPNTIEFEYIYTGRNIDILEFDMKLNFGLAYLQTATLGNTYKDQGETLPCLVTVPDIKQVIAAGERTSANINTPGPADIPVFFSTSLELPSNRSNNNIEHKAAEVVGMSKHASLEVLDVSMKITGNLTLLQSTAVASGGNIDAVPEGEVFDWGYIPAFAKIHIKMPSYNDDIGLFDGSYSQYGGGYAKDFWFQGHYYILGIEHVFSDGEFTQNLTMIGLPEPSALDGKEKKDYTAKFSSSVANCYNGVKDCPPPNTQQSAGTTNAAAVIESPSAAAASTQQNAQVPADQIDAIVPTISADTVQGWKTMSPTVKQAITTAASSSSIPLSTYAAIASIESNGKPGAVSPTGAVGIFQFVGKTWNEQMPSNPITPSTERTKDDPRLDVDLSAKAARNYLTSISKRLGGTTAPTWLYMGHNLGITATPIIYKAHKAGKGDLLISEIYAANPTWRKWPLVAKENGYNINSTVTTIRDQIAAKYVKRLEGVNVSQQAPSTTTPAEQGAKAAQTPGVQQTPKTESGRKAAQNINKANGNACSDSTNASASKDKTPDNCSKDKTPAGASAKKPKDNRVVVKVGAASVLMTPEEAKKQRGY